MRSRSFLIALPLVALLYSPAVLAQVTDDVVMEDVEQDDVMFVSGTGDDIEEEDSRPPGRESVHDRDEESKMRDMADKITDPVVQEGVATAVERASSAIMHMPIGDFVGAIENARPGTVKRRLRRDATVADLAGRDAEDLPERLGDSSREMMGMVGGFARAMAVMMPEFERMGREMEESVRAAKAAARRD